LRRLRSSASHPGTTPGRTRLLFVWLLEQAAGKPETKPGVTIKQMQDEWKKVNSDGELVKFTCSEIPDGRVFLTAQIAGHEVVCSVILPKPEHPFSRETVESYFKHGTNFVV
jgi:hypothetical protein